MPNILINPESGFLEFNTGSASGSAFDTSLSGAARLKFQNSGELNLTSLGTGVADKFTVDGSNGRLLTVNNTVTGSIFSVNDVAGLPIVEVFSDDRVVMGQYATDALVVSGSGVTFANLPTVSGNPVMTGDSSFDSDTLQTVTDRGATTTNSITTNGLASNGNITTNSNGIGIFTRTLAARDGNGLAIRESTSASGISINSLGNTTVDGNITINDGKYIGQSDSLSTIVFGNLTPGNETADLSFLTSADGEFTFKRGTVTKMTMAGDVSVPSSNFKVNTDTLFVDISDDRVGIGTASPIETLHVFGRTRLGGRGYTGGASIEYASLSETNGGASTIVGNAVYAGNANNTFRKTRSDAGNYIQLNYNKGITFHTNVTGSASSTEYDINNHEQVRITTGGYVGIGTTIPARELEVVGGIRTNNDGIQFTDSNAFINRGGSYMQLRTYAGNDIILMAGGNVGVGTNNPLTELDVRGDVSGSGNFLGTGAGNRITNNGTPYLLSGDAAASLTLQDVCDNGNTTTTTIQATSFTGTAGLNQFKGSTADTASHTIVARNSSNTSLFSIRNDGRIDIPVGPVVVDTDTLYIDTSNDVVGINQSSPSSTYALDVGGSIRMATAAPSLVLRETDSSNQEFSVFGLGGDFYVRDITQSTYPLKIEAGVANDTLVLASGGNVGIGTNDPQKNLDIQGQFMVRPTSNTTIGRVLIGSTSSDAYLELKDASSNNKVFLNTDGVSYFNGGNVGIGTDTASTIGGTARLTVQNSSVAMAWGPSVGEIVYHRRLSAGKFQIVPYYGGNIGELQLAPYGENDTPVVIGGTAAVGGVKLDVRGNISGSGNFLGTGDGNRITNNGVPYLLSGDAAASLTLQDVTDNGATTTNNIEIEGAGSKSLTVDSTDGHASVVIDRHSTSYDANLSFQTNGTTKWRLWNDGNDTTLAVRDEANASNVMTWEAGGNVGIGTDNPSKNLSVYAAGNAQAQITGTNVAILSISDPNSHGQLNTYNDGTFRINSVADAAGTQLVLSGSSVGIGVAKPPHKLSVKGTVSRLNSSSIQVVNLGTASEHGQLTINNNGGTNRVTLNSDGSDSYISVGNVGIGTNSPSTILDLNKANAISELTIRRDGSDPGTNTDIGGIQFKTDYSATPQEAGRILLKTNASAYRTDMKFSVRSTAGAEKIGMTLHGTVDSDPYLGIRTQTPVTELHVGGEGNATISGTGTCTEGADVFIYGSGNSDVINAVRARNDASIKVTSQTAGAYFRTNSATSIYNGLDLNQNWFIGQYGHNDLRIVDGTASAGDAAAAVTVQNSTKYVGIGQTSPQTILDVDGAANHGIRIGTNNALIGEGGSTGTQLIFWNGTSAYYGRSAAPFTHTVSNHFFRIGGSDQMTIRSTGVGIGTNNPTTKLEVSGAVSDSLAAFRDGSDGVEIATRGSSRQQIDFLGSNTSAINAKGSLHINYDSDNGGSNDSIQFTRNGIDEAGTLDMIIKEGKVGVGTASPDYTLTVDAGATNEIARFRSTDNDALISISDNTSTGYIGIDAANDVMSLGFDSSMGTSSNLNITTAGYVGIGTNAASYPLVIRTAGDGIKLDVTDGVDANFRVNVNGAVTEVGPSTANFALMAGGAERARIDANGVGIGTNAPSYELDVVGTTRSTYYIGGAYFEENASSSKIKFYPNGTVLVIDEDGELKPCEKENDTLVFGVSKRDFEQPIVLGAEPILVTGPIKVGDYIVTSNKQGHGQAIKEQNLGTIIAQAMENGDGESYNIKAMIRKM